MAAARFQPLDSAQLCEYIMLRLVIMAIWTTMAAWGEGAGVGMGERERERERAKGEMVRNEK